VLTSGGYEFPWLVNLSEGTYYKQGDGALYTMQDGDIPYFLVHLDHQSRLFRVEIFDAIVKAWHRAYNEEYLPRNSGATSFFAFPFDGTTVGGQKALHRPRRRVLRQDLGSQGFGRRDQSRPLGDLDLTAVRHRPPINPKHYL
jgi:minor extracellular serine protease Vpr